MMKKMVLSHFRGEISGSRISGSRRLINLQSRRGYHNDEPTTFYKVFKTCVSRCVFIVSKKKSDVSPGCANRLIGFMTWMENQKNRYLHWGQGGGGAPPVTCYHCSDKASKDFATGYTSTLLWLLFGTGTIAKFTWDLHLSFKTSAAIDDLYARNKANKIQIVSLRDSNQASLKLLEGMEQKIHDIEEKKKVEEEKKKVEEEKKKASDSKNKKKGEARSG